MWNYNFKKLLNIDLDEDTLMYLIDTNILAIGENTTLGTEMYNIILRLNLSDERRAVIRRVNGLRGAIEGFGSKLSIKGQYKPGLQELHIIKILRTFVFNVLTDKEYDIKTLDNLEQYINMKYNRIKKKQEYKFNNKKANEAILELNKNNAKRQFLGLPEIRIVLYDGCIELITDSLAYAKLKSLPRNMCYIVGYESFENIILDKALEDINTVLLFRSSNDKNSLLLDPYNKLNYWENLFLLYKYMYIKLQPDLEIKMWRKILWILKDSEIYAVRFKNVIIEIAQIFGTDITSMNYNKASQTTKQLIRNRIKELQNGKQ